jgi:hypothetical protein
MPSIDTFVEKGSSNKKKFKKVAHRPWTVISSINIQDYLDNDHQAINETNLSKDAEVLPTELNRGEETQNLEVSDNNLDDTKLESPHPTPIVSETITEQFRNNSETNQKQLTNTPETIKEQLTNTDVYEQFTNNSETIQKQTNNNYQTINKQVVESLGNNSQIVNEQFRNNSETKFPKWNHDQTIVEYAKLVGFQKKVFLYIAKRCIANDSLVSGPITKQDLKDYISSDLDTIKTSIQRLVHKGFLYRELSKSGTGGFSIFSIAAPIKKLILDELNNKSVREQFINNSGTVIEQPDVSSSSYNNIYNKTTTNPNRMFSNGLPIVSETNDEQEILLTHGWENIDISNLEFIGFSKSHLNQLQKRSELTPEIIQDSINAFAFDLKHNGVGDKIKTHPLNYLMGVLRANQPYAAPSNYQDPKVLAMREYLERKKQQREEQKRVEEEIFQFDFEDWQINLSEEDIAAIIPEARYREYPMKEGFLKTHFRKNVWEHKRKTIKS